MRYTPDSITFLEENEIFVFGSNLAGRHGAGPQRFGAEYGRGIGLYGSQYAIPTKGYRLEVLPIEIITGYVNSFIQYAKKHPELKFLVTQIGCGYARYTPEQIAPLFFSAYGMDNVVLPESFVKVIEKMEA